MKPNDILDEAEKILKKEQWRRSKTVMCQLFGDVLGLEMKHENLILVQRAAVNLGWDCFDKFSPIYDLRYGKRRNSTAKSATTNVYVGQLLSETEKSYGFDDGKTYGPYPTLFYVPKSQCTYNQESGELTLPIWLAMEKNIW